MGKLASGMMTSLDGYINDVDGRFDWGFVDEEVHRHAEAEQARAAVTIYGRRMFEVMAASEMLGDAPGAGAVERDFAAVWKGADKPVVSRSLPEATTTRTRLVRAFTAADLTRLKAETPGEIAAVVVARLWSRRRAPIENASKSPSSSVSRLSRRFRAPPARSNER